MKSYAYILTSDTPVFYFSFILFEIIKPGLTSENVILSFTERCQW